MCGNWSRVILPQLLLGGCLSASVPSGGYLCAPADNACPAGQHCTCGLCVSDDKQAACKFQLTLDAADELTIHEHEKLNLSIAALTSGNAPASGFRGSVALSFRLPDGTVWGDVNPPSASLSGGRAQLQVTVNRETIPPQKPQLEARFAGGRGASVPVHVLPQPLARDPTPVAQAPWGWADVGIGSPSVIWDGAQFRMYFVGAGGRMQRGVGVATSPDGVSFSPNGVPLFPDAAFMPFVFSVAPYQLAAGWRILVYAADSKAHAIYAAASPDGQSPFSLLNGGAPVIAQSSCAYCDFSVWTPSVIHDGDDWLAFFGAAHCEKPAHDCMGISDNVSMSIGRARSSDGASFAPEPAPVLSGDMGGETYLAAPQVLKDGSIFKMWYAFTRQVAFNDPCLAQVDVGYATSTDGFYWVRSPSNPVLALDGNGWEGNTRAMLPASVVPADGKDFDGGVFLYYSALATILVPPYCIPSGIGRAR
jgi:hypothetical protein